MTAGFLKSTKNKMEKQLLIKSLLLDTEIH